MKPYLHLRFLHYFAAASAVLLVFTSILSAASSKIVTPEQAKKLIEKGAVVIDVRTPEEYKAGYIPGAINIDFYSDDFEAKLSKLDKNKEYLIYCRSGNRSGKTVIIMQRLGFSKLYDMPAAYAGWIGKGYPSTK